MTDRRLPGLDYTADLGSDDFEYGEEMMTDELRRRTQLLIGAYRAAGASYGIASEINPRLATASSDAFFVQPNEGDASKFDVYPGMAVTRSGDVVVLTAAQTSLTPSTTPVVNDQVVVFVEHEVVPDTDLIEPNMYLVPVARQRRRLTDAELVRSVPLSVWNDGATFTEDRLQYVVPIAHLTFVDDGTNTNTLKVVVSLDETHLTGNRPHFSPIDIDHRLQVGTGSASTPHRLSISDLSQGAMTLYQQLLRHGIVLARDVSLPGIPGTLCSEVIDPVREMTDTTGTVTGSPYAKYYTLLHYPVRLLGVVALTDSTREIAARVIPHTNILMVHSDESIGTSGARVYYTYVSAAEPPVVLTNNDMLFGQPIEGSEVLIAGGKGSAVVAPSITDAFGVQKARVNISSAGPFPRRYQVWADSSGALMTAPQILLCATVLEQLGTIDMSVAQPLGNGRLIFGLANTTPDPLLSLVIRVTGTSAVTGATIVDDVTFSSSNYSPYPAVPTSTEASGYYVKTNSVFAAGSVTIRVMSKVAISPTALLTVLADLDSNSPQFRDAAPIAELMWNGQAVERIRDIRRISTTLTMPTRTSPVKLASQALLGAAMHNSNVQAVEIVADDFRDPQYASITQSSTASRISRFSDGLRSIMLPQRTPTPESSANSEDIWYTQALMLPDPSVITPRIVQLVLFGIDVDHSVVQTNDGIAASVEYRVGQKNAYAWDSWLSMTPSSYSDGVSFYSSALPADYATAFKIQFRIKGQAAGFAAYVRPNDIAQLNVPQLWGAGQVVRLVSQEVTGGNESVFFDAAAGNTFFVRLGGANPSTKTLTGPTGMRLGGNYRWILEQDAAGGKTVAFSSTFKWASGIAPSFPTTANSVSIIDAIFDGTRLLCTSVQDVR